MKKLKRKWFFYSTAGILIMGIGLSVFGEAVIAKALTKGFLNWFLRGTVGLALIFAGLSIFGQGVVFKTIIDQKKHNL
jgi:hypothetical protein